jgi:hypothetical protein
MREGNCLKFLLLFVLDASVGSGGHFRLMGSGREFPLRINLAYGCKRNE